MSIFAKSTSVVLAVMLAAAGRIGAADPAVANPNQAQIDQLAQQTALVKVETEAFLAEVALLKAKYPALGDNFGKAGALSFDSAGRDNFHVTARTAQAFQSAAEELAKLFKDDGNVVLLTEADRSALPAYWVQQQALLRIERRFTSLLPPLPKIDQEAASLALFGLSAALSQLQQLPKAFKSDKALSFTDAELPDDFLLDLVAVKSPGLLYVSAALDGVLTDSIPTDFTKKLGAVDSRRAELIAWAGADKARKEQVAEATKELDALVTILLTPETTTKVPLLVTVLRGELAAQFLTRAKGKVLTVRVASKGGASLRTSNWWRSDRLYAAGGVTVLYRLTDGAALGQVKKAGIVNAETPFVQVPLD